MYLMYFSTMYDYMNRYYRIHAVLYDNGLAIVTNSIYAPIYFCYLIICAV